MVQTELIQPLTAIGGKFAISRKDGRCTAYACRDGRFSAIAVTPACRAIAFDGASTDVSAVCAIACTQVAVRLVCHAAAWTIPNSFAEMGMKEKEEQRWGHRSDLAKLVPGHGSIENPSVHDLPTRSRLNLRPDPPSMLLN